MIVIKKTKVDLKASKMPNWNTWDTKQSNLNNKFS